MNGEASALQQPPQLTRRILLSALCGSAALCLAPGRASADFASLAPVSYVVGDEATYDRALSYSARLRKAALVYFGAGWCSICKTLERSTFHHSEVSGMLQSIALVKIDVTAMNGASRTLLRRFHVAGPPTLFVVSTSSGEEYAGTRMVGRVTVRDLVERLRPFAT